MKRFQAADISYFYPRSPCGERPQCRTLASGIYGFLSTLSLRRATKKGSGKSTTLTHFYPRSPCGERQPVYYVCRHRSGISIHALLAESDPSVDVIECLNNPVFLSTLSLRRATISFNLDTSGQNNFYPRSPCGERRVWIPLDDGSLFISIHALLAESDGINPDQSGKTDISIHALLAESDLAVPDLGKRDIWISIHALLAESDRLPISAHRFDSGISIHALLAESDLLLIVNSILF